MLLLSWTAQGGGRGIVTLDLLNCTEVRSVASPTHPGAQDDVGTIAAKAQTANAQAEGFGSWVCWKRCALSNCFTVTAWSDWVQRRLGIVCAGSVPSGMSYRVGCFSSS